MTLIQLIGGFVLLVYGADWFVNGAAAIARRLRIPPFVIGLTLVSMGTSLPEFVVNMLSAWNGQTDIALGNIVGSNIFNTLAILGIGSLVKPMHVSRRVVRIDLSICILVTILLYFLVIGDVYSSKGIGSISFFDGMILIVGMCSYLWYLLRQQELGSDVSIPSMSGVKMAIYIACGLGALVFGSHLLIDGSVSIAKWFGLSDRVIGLTIIAAGTSLPELATTIQASLKNQHDIAFGNIVGSNIFNILWILGFTALVQTVPVSPQASSDLIVSLGAVVALLGLVFVGKRYVIERWQGALLLSAYVAYTVHLLTG